MKRFEPHGRARDPFAKAVILLDDVVEVLGQNGLDQRPHTPDLPDHIDRLNASQIGPTLINNNAFGGTVALNSVLQKSSCRSRVSALGQHEIKGLPVSINGSVEILSVAFHLDVGFIHAPGIGCWSFSGLSCLGNQRRELHDLAVQCRVIDIHPTFVHDFFQIPVRHTKAYVQIHRIKDCALGIMDTLEINRHRWLLAFKIKYPLLTQYNSHIQSQKFATEPSERFILLLTKWKLFVLYKKQ